MKKLNGCHFYINIKNLDEVVLEEENKTGRVEHSIHALDTFFSSIERYGKSNYSDIFYVEKITGSRLHMYILDNISNSFDVVNSISAYAYYLTGFLNKEISKYKTLLNFEIQVGCCFGDFYDFIFKNEGKEEETSIGFVANYAAKLQSITESGYISISSNIYNDINDKFKPKFARREATEIKKYKQDYYYTAQLVSLNRYCNFDKELQFVREYANKINLSQINFSTVNKQINFENVSKTESKKIEGIPLFADVRGFTQKFDEDGVNLEEMAILTQNILTTMYDIIKVNGTHVQFQGDREFALFHNYGQYDCCVDAVLAGMKIIDKIQNYNVCIGVGQSIGNLFVSKIGARGEKDNIVIGKTVTEADYYEDNIADENQIVISHKIYLNLLKHNSSLAKQFIKKDYYYYTTVGYDTFIKNVQYASLKMSNERNSYNGAWGIL